MSTYVYIKDDHDFAEFTILRKIFDEAQNLSRKLQTELSNIEVLSCRQQGQIISEHYWLSSQKQLWSYNSSLR